MESNRTPIWPIQCVLFGLFLAVLAAPRAWERVAHPQPPQPPGWSAESRWVRGDSQRLAQLDLLPLAPPAPEPLVEPEPAPAVASEVRLAPYFPPPPTVAPSMSCIVPGPLAELRLDRALAQLRDAEPESAPEGPRLALANQTPRVRPLMRMPVHRPRAKAPAERLPQDLLDRLARLTADDEAGMWAWQAALLVRQVSAAKSAGGEPSAALAELARLQQLGLDAAERRDGEIGVLWRRAAHALNRQLAAWRVGDRGELAAAGLLEEPGVPVSHSVTDALAALVERYERDPAPSAGRRLAMALARLAEDPTPESQALAAQYEQANVRLAVTDDLLTRMTPVVPDTIAEVRESMEGARVRGRSVASRQLRIETIPDPLRFHLRLAAEADITADTVASKGPGHWFNRAQGQVDVARGLRVGPHGFHLEPGEADARATLRILDVRTKLDGIPFLSQLMRETLRSAGERKTPQARRRFQSRVETEAMAELDRLSSEKIGALEQLVEQRLAAPLREMGVHSKWVAGQTTAERASLRIRVAGEHQLGAHTPRPRAPGNSLASLQIHQSACNNVLERLDLAGRTFGLEDLFEHVRTRLHRPQARVLPDLPEGVEITFADEDPVRVTFADGAVELALRVRRLSSGDQGWRDFVVRARYVAEPRTGRLEREESIRLAGTGRTKLGVRSQIALRSIFTKVFSKNQRVDLMKPLRQHERTADLVFSQFKLDDGWLAVAVGAAPNESLARRQGSR